ncbi:MAG: hypothetical protein AABY83_03185 [Pseudomonadota bacterium]
MSLSFSYDSEHQRIKEATGSGKTTVYLNPRKSQGGRAQSLLRRK